MSALYKLAVVCVLAAVVAAVEKPCCISKKWTGLLRVITASIAKDSTMPIITENALMFDYDHDMRMERANGRIVTKNGTMETISDYSVYTDFRHMRRYVMTSQDSTCNVEQVMGDQTEPCVPSALKWDGSFMVGSTTEGVMVNSWSGDVDNFHWTMFTSVNDCTPVLMNRFGTTPDGTRVSEETVYANVTQYMTTPSAFVLPDICQNSGGVPIGK